MKLGIEARVKVTVTVRVKVNGKIVKSKEEKVTGEWQRVKD